jgi:hypothetical protein
MNDTGDGCLRVPTTPEELAELLGEPYQETGDANTVITHCPAHPDRNPSLVITLAAKGRRKGKLVLHCRAGCTHAEVMGSLAALGISIDGMSAQEAQEAHQDLEDALGDPEAVESTQGAEQASEGHRKGGGEGEPDASAGDDPDGATAKPETRGTREQLQQAGQLWATAIDLAGTLAERCLTEQRGLPVPALWYDAVRQQDVIRYSPGGPLTTKLGAAQGPCMLVGITTAKGIVTGYQITPLDAEGRKRGRFTVGSVKPGIGMIRIRQPGPGGDDKLPVLVIAEGLETGLSRLAVEDEPFELWVTGGPLPQAIYAWAKTIARDRLHRAEGAYDWRLRWSRVELAIDRDKEADSHIAARLTSAATRVPVARLLAPPEVTGKGADLNDVLRARGWVGLMAVMASAPTIPAGHALMAPKKQESTMVEEFVRATWQNLGLRNRLARDGILYGWDPAAGRWGVIAPEALANEISELIARSFEITDDGEVRPWQQVNSNLIQRLIRRALEQATEFDLTQPGVQTYRLGPDHGAELLDDWLVFIGNQMLNTRTWEIAPAGQDVFALNVINADPRHLEVEPQLFEKVLHEAFGSIDDFTEADVEQQIRRVYEMLGHAISGGRLNLQKLIFLVGAPGTGKSVIERVIEALIGTGCANSAISSLGGPHGMVNLVGASVIKLSDVRGSMGWRKSELGELALSNLLKITGGDPVLINPKYRPEFTAVLSQCVIAISNDIPGFLIDGHGALGRRLEVIDFGLPDPDRMVDPTLADMIIQYELPGILGRALDGLDRLREAGSFSTSLDLQKRQLVTLGEIEPLRGFAEYLMTAPGKYLRRQELYDGGMRFLIKEGMKHLPTQQSFIRQLRRALLVTKGISLPTEPAKRSVDGKNERVWLDLFWTEDTPDDIQRDTSHIRAIIKDLDDGLE